MLDKIIEWLEKFNEELNVIILEDNIHTVKELNIKKDQFIRELSKNDFSLNGIGSNEFYLTINNSEFTFQVYNFEFDETFSEDLN